MNANEKFCTFQEGRVTWNECQWKDEFESAKNEQDWNKVRALRKEVFLSTISIVKARCYITSEGEHAYVYSELHDDKNTRFYDHEIFPRPSDERYRTQIAVVNADCLDFAREICRKEDDVCILNMASRQNPGGGVYNGAGAQEEYLFRCSDYYLSLYRFAPYASSYGIRHEQHSYPLDRNFGGCFSRDVSVFRGSEESGYPLLADPWRANFIAVAGMNRPKTVYINGEERIDAALVHGIKNKMRTIFRIAMDNGQKTLILGALGCGAFKNPPRHTAELFREVMNEEEFSGVFRRIIFAIKEDHNSQGSGNVKPFRDVFGALESGGLIPEANLQAEPHHVPYRAQPYHHSFRLLHREAFGNGCFYWSLYDNGILEISGTGRMPNYINHWDRYGADGGAPWIGCEKYGRKPSKLVVREGITHIGDNAFECYGYLKEIELPNSLTSLGYMTFLDCFHVERVTLPPTTIL